MLRHLLQDQITPDATFKQAVKALLKSIFVVRHMATAGFRWAQILGRIWPPLGFLAKQGVHIWTGADLAWQADVGRGLSLLHPTGVVWGPGVKVGVNCKIQQGVTIGGRGGSGIDGSPIIGDDVELGAGSRIIGPVNVGSRCIVGANAVVLHDTPADSIAVGVPARVRKSGGDASPVDNS